jgi:hypothetical protein
VVEMQLKADPLWSEDDTVTKVIRIINDLRHTIARMRRGGFAAMRLPEFKKQEIIAHVRKGFRENRHSAPKTLMPDEWKEVLRAVQFDISVLAPLSPPDPLPRSGLGYAYHWEDFSLESPDDYVPEEPITSRRDTACAAGTEPLFVFQEGEKNMHNPGDSPPPEPLARPA